MLDYGVELAAWIELRSPDLTAAAVAAGCVTMSVGESSVQQFFSPSRLSPKVHNATNPLFAGWKTAVPAQYAGGVFRLELNAQLYEGVRYGFLHVNAQLRSLRALHDRVRRRAGAGEAGQLGRDLLGARLPSAGAGLVRRRLHRQAQSAGGRYRVHP